jgi:subtilisin family serine protease
MDETCRLCSGQSPQSGGRISASADAAVSGIDINAEAAWEEYDGGKEVVVALIDTGVDYTHEDLQNAIWVNEDEITGNGVDDDGNGYIDDVYGWNFYDGNNTVYTGGDDDHGTHNAGTIAASSDNGTGIAGIARMTGQRDGYGSQTLGGTEGGGRRRLVIEANKICGSERALQS